MKNKILTVVNIYNTEDVYTHKSHFLNLVYQILVFNKYTPTSLLTNNVYSFNKRTRKFFEECHYTSWEGYYEK